MKKHLITLFLVVVCLCSMMVTPVSAWGYQPTTKTYTVNSVTKVKDVYSNWYRMNEVVTAGQSGEKATFDEKYTKKVKVTSSFSLTVPIKKVEASLGTDVELSESVTTTVYGTDSRKLRSGESAAFYYRKHWVVYNVDYTVTTSTIVWDGKGHFVRKTSTERTSGELKVPQKVGSNDRHWFYATAGHEGALTSEIMYNLCGENETYQVYRNYCPA